MTQPAHQTTVNEQNLMAILTELEQYGVPTETAIDLIERVIETTEADCGDRHGKDFEIPSFEDSVRRGKERHVRLWGEPLIDRTTDFYGQLDSD